LPGMMEDPACIGGRLISPIPARGPEESRRRSLHVLESLTPTRLSTPESCTKAPASCVASTRFAAEAGQLQLNAFEPIIAHSLFEGLTHLRNGCDTLRTRCVTGITANREHLRRTVENSIGIVTALNPYIGYANATQVAQEAHATGRSVYELVLEKGLLSKERLDEILRPEALTRPNYLPEAK